MSDPPWPTFHEHALRDMAELSEFRELRTLAVGDPDNTILATCILGRQLARHVEPALLNALGAEAVGQAGMEMAACGLKAADDLADTLGDGHPVVAEAKGLAQAAFDAAEAAFQGVERPSQETPV